MGYVKDIYDITGRLKKNREELFKLIQENPDLPIVPMVDYEIVAEDSGSLPLYLNLVPLP